MEKTPSENKQKSWFWHHIMNNRVVSRLLIILLVLLIILVFSKVAFVFAPLGKFFGIVGMPLVISTLLYYFLNPLVNILERKGMSRGLAIGVIYVGVVALITWGVIILVPKIQAQTASLADNWPSYWQTIQDKTNEFINLPIFSQYSEQLESVVESITDSLSSIVKGLSTNTVHGIGNFLGTVANWFITIFTTPFILFYLLKDGHHLAGSFVKLLPTKVRQPAKKVLIDMNNQVSQYIRGQVTVAFTVAIMFMIGFAIIGMDYSVTLGITAGILNLIPYIGSAIAMIPAIFLALVSGPVMLVKVLAVFGIEQVIEGKFVSPLVLASQLKIHPVTIIFVLLTAGKLFGIVGVIIGVPGYAALKVLVQHLFTWYKAASPLYEEE
ncbi:AI-2E family transporter [Vagococcus coleopterorum]|uniref:AI-2E family transporter n=1 Tax=Vagococcus coleopterorum TaxID=2714946 RepID=A0A6G8APJ9_9ENTE|nr:AI-2E family transporter [Vagococcus coleopterorum]QIL47001.1 AI-2E family transporter [Vagococcus coleopterorum]